MLYLQVITSIEDKKSFDLNIEKLHKRATFLKTIEYYISFNQ